MIAQLPNNLQVARFCEKAWDLKIFHQSLSELALMPRPQKMTHGLWELPLYEDISRGWKQTEFYSTEEFIQIGGIKAFEKLQFNKKLEPFFRWAYDLKTLGISVYRLRILALAPQSTQHKHIDQKSDSPILRLHLPLLTHDKAFLDYFDERDHQSRHHLPASGFAQIINVAQTHRVCNLDDRKWRLHLVCDIRAMNSNLKIDQVRTSQP